MLCVVTIIGSIAEDKNSHSCKKPKQLYHVSKKKVNTVLESYTCIQYSHDAQDHANRSLQYWKVTHVYNTAMMHRTMLTARYSIGRLHMYTIQP